MSASYAVEHQHRFQVREENSDFGVSTNFIWFLKVVEVIFESLPLSQPWSDLLCCLEKCDENNHYTIILGRWIHFYLSCKFYSLANQAFPAEIVSNDRNMSHRWWCWGNIQKISTCVCTKNPLSVIDKSFFTTSASGEEATAGTALTWIFRNTKAENSTVHRGEGLFRGLVVVLGELLLLEVPAQSHLL